MPLPNVDCGAPDPACCSRLFDHASAILAVAFDAVATCTQPGPCFDQDFNGYVTVGTQVEDPFPDYLVVSLQSFGLAPLSQTQTGGAVRVAQYLARFQVRLLEANWPMIETDNEGTIIHAPTPEQYMAAAHHSYAHGEAMFRALADAVSRRTLGSCGCSYHGISDLIPVEPSGGATGWELIVTVQIDISGTRGHGGS